MHATPTRVRFTTAQTAMTSSEQSLRESLLSAFRYFEPQGRSVVHAADFQQALASVGLSFGTEFVDRVMLQCKIDAEGYVRGLCAACALVRALASCAEAGTQVDFSEFASTVTNARSGRPAPAAHGAARRVLSGRDVHSLTNSGAQGAPASRGVPTAPLPRHRRQSTCLRTCRSPSVCGGLRRSCTPRSRS